MVTNEIRHMAEILTSRVGGFGGSDAKLLHKIGENGIASLSNTDKKRIAVMKGLVPYEAIVETTAMKAGRMFEDYVETMYSDYEREVRLSAGLTDKFLTFAHADFCDERTWTVVECKYSQKSTDDVINDYKHQLQWYYLMGAEEVVLIHGTGGVEPFAPENPTILQIPQNKKLQETMLLGVKILAEEINNPILELGVNGDITDLPAWDRDIIEAFIAAAIEVEINQARVDKYRAQVLLIMQDNGISKIEADGYSISSTPPSTRSSFDKVKFAKAHPDINLDDFNKVSNVKSSVRINLKK